MTTKPTIYIAGKIGAAGITAMRGKFDQAHKWLEWNNWIVVNPCDIPDAESWEGCMIRDLHAMLDCNALFLLNNWRTSPGATIEMQLALRLRKPVIYQIGTYAAALSLESQAVCICPACVLDLDARFCPFYTASETSYSHD